VQFTSRVPFIAAIRSPALAGPVLMRPPQSAGPAHQPHSTPAWCTPSATLVMKISASIAKAGRAAFGRPTGPATIQARAASGTPK